jgi:hypothetical protein
MAGSRGLSLMACSSSGITSSIDPVKNLHRARACNACTQLGLYESAASIFRYGLGISKLRPQQLALGEMCQTAVGGCGQGLPGQGFCTRQICRGRVGHIIDDAGREVGRQTAPGVDGLRIECQRTLKKRNRLRISFARWRPTNKKSTRTKDVVYCDGVLAWPSGLRPPELEVKCHCDAARDLVLQSEQIARIAVETLSP